MRRYACSRSRTTVHRVLRGCMHFPAEIAAQSIRDDRTGLPTVRETGVMVDHGQTRIFGPKGSRQRVCGRSGGQIGLELTMVAHVFAVTACDLGICALAIARYSFGKRIRALDDPLRTVGLSSSQRSEIRIHRHQQTSRAQLHLSGFPTRHHEVRRASGERSGLAEGWLRVIGHGRCHVIVNPSRCRSGQGRHRLLGAGR
jgi:hypothetical protein